MRRLLFVFVAIVTAAFAADTDLVGSYKGEWKSNNSGNGGEFFFVLGNSGGTWTCEAGFTLDGSQVKGTAKRVKVEDGKVEMVYEFEIQGYALRSSHRGAWNGTEFKGTYETTTADGSQAVDAGTWTAKPNKAAAAPADADLTGSFTGTYKNEGTGDTGPMRFSLKKTGNTWSGEVGITYQGSEIPGNVRSLKVENGSLELVYDCNVQGSDVRITQRGTWNGSEFTGTFTGILVESGETVGGGPWSAKKKS